MCQLLSQLLPPSIEKACSQCAEVAVTFEASLYHGTARIRLSPLGMDRLSVLAAAAIAMARATASAPDAMGWVDAEIPIESTDHAARELLKLGTEVEVLEPVALRDAMRGIADALAARYGG